MTEWAWVTGMKELLTLPDRDLSPEMLEERGRSYRKHLDCLTDRQWQYAVDRAIKAGDAWFPTVSKLLEYGDTTPPASRVLPWDAPVCDLCEGSGFQPFERSGHSWVRFCPRGCRVGMERARDYRTDDERREDNAKGLALCREAMRKRGIDVDTLAAKVSA